jgi:hypothetical protein
MWHRNIFRMSAERAEALMASRRAREACVHFGVPYAARMLPLYRDEITRLKPGILPVGCLNQAWPGPVVVWYPEGNWINQEAIDER